MRKIGILFLACFLITAIFVFSKGQAEKGGLGKAIDFTLNDINGNIFKLSDHSGKVVILNFFATWCPPCRMEMPDFENISKKYRNDVVIVAVNVANEPLDTIKDFVAQNGLTFAVLQNKGNVANAYGPIRAIPVTFVIDRDFNIARKYIGARAAEVFVKDIEQLR